MNLYCFSVGQLLTLLTLDQKDKVSNKKKRVQGDNKKGETAKPKDSTSNSKKGETVNQKGGAEKRPRLGK